MDSHQTWSDFHLLNKTFRDTLEECSTNWIETALVRFSYSGSRDKALRPTIDALDDLLVEYAAPFPLTYLFGLHISGTYRSVFVFLLQLRRAKNVLENARIWDTTTRHESKRSLNKVVFAMRSKLIWFIK
jgi:gamma-tubulin complex component 5